MNQTHLNNNIMNSLLKKIKEDVQYMKNTHVNDPKTMVLLDEIELLLAKEPQQTVSVLKELDLSSIEWICSTFEAVSYKLLSKDFIDCLDELLIKFNPNINAFKDEVQEAKDCYYDNL
ncbi:hypothetical protein DZC78_10145 [Olleya aquimaris]|nr:hypothetical protein DZC78_10145 [Olleya aquimaris]